MASKLRIRPDRKKWRQQALNDAMKAVLEGQSVKSASNEYGIPRKTLSDYLKRGNGSTKLRTGPSTVFFKRARRRTCDTYQEDAQDWISIDAQ
jgi:hypothetical protein